LLQLLTHENVDIAMDVLQLFAELLDPSSISNDVPEDDEDTNGFEISNIQLLMAEIVSNYR
ncbi:MAG: hypothetical protein ACK4ON_00390, partial [Bacteroidia bacterium]